MKYVFNGVVSFDEHDFGPGLLIGGEDLISNINFPKGTKVICGIMDDRWDGELSIESGYGYSEYTPMEYDTLSVGDHDLLDILSRYEGKRITFFISDGPINLLDQVNP